MMDWIRHRATATALSVASVLIGVKLLTSSIFDFAFDIIVLGLILFVGKINGRRLK
jgi:hypothetical protein